MKMYFDIYLRPAGAVIDDAALALGNILDGFDRLELPDTGAKLVIEPELKELGDGTSIVEAEKILAECGTLRVDTTEYAYLRSTFHNKLCDLLLYDSSSNTIVALVFGIRMAVTKGVQSGSSVIIKISGGKTSYDVNLVLLTPAVMQEFGLVSGTVFAADGTTPVDGAEVTIDSEATPYKDVTDKDGKYLILAYKVGGTYPMTVQKSPLNFPEQIAVLVGSGETIKNISALS